MSQALHGVVPESLSAARLLPIPAVSKYFRALILTLVEVVGFSAALEVLLTGYLRTLLLGLWWSRLVVVSSVCRGRFQPLSQILPEELIF